MRIAIVTAVCGNSDILRDPSIVHAGVDYHAFVDNKFPCKVWNQHAAPHFSSDSRFAARRHARMCKIVPQLFLPDYDFHIWVDATHEVAASPSELIESYLQHHPLAVFRHFARSCVYAEAETILSLDLDHADRVHSQMNYYRSCGFPAGNGLYETAGFVRRNCPEGNEVSLRWWEQVCRFSSRDQLSLPFVVWKLQVSLGILDGYPKGIQPEDGRVVAYSRLIPQVRQHAS